MRHTMRRAYGALIIVVITTFIISLSFRGVFTMEEMSFYLTVTGLIYGLIAAFTVSNTWEKFSLIRAATGEEISSLANLYGMSKLFKDKVLPKKLGKLISTYCNYVVATSWRDYNFKQLGHPKFQALFNCLAEVKPKCRKKDPALWQNFIAEVQDFSTARTQQLTLASHGVSWLRWFLLIFLSGALISGMLLTISPSGPTVSAFVNTIMTAAILLILLVIYELNMLEFEVEVISNEPYRRLAKFVTKN